MLPHHIRTLEDFWLWLDKLLDGSGGWLAGPALEVRPIEVAPEVWEGLIVENQRLYFHDGFFLEFHLVVDQDLRPIEYSFHYQGQGETLVWRKDKHPGHSADEHIHRPGASEPEPFEEVDLGEVLDEIHGERP